MQVFWRYLTTNVVLQSFYQAIRKVGSATDGATGLFACPEEGMQYRKGDKGMPKLELDLMTVKQAAGRLDVSIWTVYRAIQDGQLRCYDFGPHAQLVDACDVDRLKADREANPPKSRRKKRNLVTA
jgi:excisionase family DNA binding protein